MQRPTPAAYPGHRDVDVVLKDGSTVHVRPVLPDDRQGLGEFLMGLSEESRIFRFFTAVTDVSWAAGRFVDVDYRERLSLVALRGEPEDIVGHGYYALTTPGRAEVALAVADRLQGMGLGTALLGQLADAAAGAGIAEFEAEVMYENFRMLEVFRQSGLPLVTRSGRGVIHLEMPTSFTPEAVERFERREQLSAIAAMHWFFGPRAVAVVGASRQRGTIGGEVFHNLLTSGFPGPVYPVSPHPVVQSVPAFSDVRAVPGEVDLAVVVVPAAAVVDAARACAEKGVRALIVISSGFAETGEEGRLRQAELLEVCRSSGMRLIGPNCMGILSTDPDRPLDATFSPAFPPPGRVAFLSQSGALGLAVIAQAGRLGLGLSAFVSVGNKADISGNDLLEHWEQDERTDVLLLYLESFGNPRRFSRIARRVSRRKPIVAVKSGRTLAGARATSSHTGALLASSDVTVDALFEQSGVVRVESLGELFDVASLLVAQPPPAGRRVGIVTNAGGPGILCADACVAGGLDVPELDSRAREDLATFLPAAASLSNPVDVIASASPEDLERTLVRMGRDDAVDAVIAIHIPPLAARPGDAAAAVLRAARELGGTKPVLAVLMTPERPAMLADGDLRVPVFAFPEDAARALARVVRWSRWRAGPVEGPARPDGLRTDDARAVVSAELGRGGGWLGPAQVAALLECYGIQLAPWRLAASPEEAAAAAAELGGAVAIKGVAPSLVHKTELGAVALGLEGEEEVRLAAARMAERVAAAGHPLDSFLVQAMVAPAAEMIVGVVQDALFGPVVACGAGGVTVELLRDVRVGLAPLTSSDADRMIRSLASFPLLDGYRGRPRADVAALRDLLLRVSALADDQPDVAELDLNPVMVLASGVTVADARVRLEATPPRPPEGSRPHPTVAAQLGGPAAAR